MAAEYEHEAVPAHAKRSLFSVAAVWTGFPLVMIGAFVGGEIVDSLGFLRGMEAIAVGNLILAVYVAFLSALAARESKTFGLSAKHLFGPITAKIVSITLSTLVVGWFAVQTGLAGTGVVQLTGLPAWISTLLIGIVFIIMSLSGMRILKPLSIISILLFAVVAIVSLIINFTHSSAQQMVAFQPDNHRTVSFGIGLTMVISCFIDSGTLTADFTRWSKTPSQAVIASLCAFPFGNMIPMLLGGIVVASQNSSSGDFSHLLSQWGPAMAAFGALFFVVNCSSVAVHGLYNATAGWSALFPLSFKSMTITLGIIGLVLAISGITNWLTNWLELLGILVPGIGGAIMGWMISRVRHYVPKIMALAWILSILIGFIVNVWMPELSTAVVVILISLSISFIGSRMSRPTNVYSEQHSISENKRSQS
ncbi:Cytosine permease [Halomonadaceae bacterium LMG 33818]|uniref:purine-cytosine permease family protein n=1 Tax=Cernens ardua TaxID=3402176 RepID=UPI003EDC9666